MHVLILNQTFHPDVAATGQLMWDLARHLVASGDRVSVATSRAYYGTDRRHARAFERLDGIDVHRLGGTAFGKKSLAGRMADFTSFYAAAAHHLSAAPAPDVILALTSPPMVSTLAALQKQFRRGPGGRRVALVYHVMDLYPDAAVASGMLRAGGPVERLLRRLTGRTLSLSDAVIALGRDMKERLVCNHGRDANPARIHVVPPWADGRALSPLDKRDNPLAAELGLADTFTVAYSGNLGVAHDIETLVGAMRLTRDDPRTTWLFVGGGKHFSDLRDRVTAAGWTHVRFLPFQERSALNRSLNLADVHLVSQLPAFTGVVVPSKLFGIMAVGKPAVMVGPADAECSRVLNDAGAGHVVPNGDAAGLVARLRELRNNPDLRRQMGRRARAAFEAEYDMPVACERIRRILHDAAEAPRERGG